MIQILKYVFNCCVTVLISVLDEGAEKKIKREQRGPHECGHRGWRVHGRDVQRTARGIRGTNEKRTGTREGREELFSTGKR